LHTSGPKSQEKGEESNDGKGDHPYCQRLATFANHDELEEGWMLVEEKGFEAFSWSNAGCFLFIVFGTSV